MTQAIGSLRFLQCDGGREIKHLWKSYTVDLGRKFLLPGEIQEMLGQVISSIRRQKDVCATLDFLAQVLPLSLIEESIRLKGSEYPGVLAAAKNLSQELSHVFPQKIAGRSVWKNVSFYTFFVALESFLKSLGLIDLFKPVIGVYDEEVKGQKMVLLSTLFSTLTTTFVPLMGPVSGGLAVGGFFSLLVLLSFLYPLWRPLPNYLPKVENWTEKYAQDILVEGDVRRLLLDQIIDTLECSKYDRLQVMLVGKPGVGKTELVKMLAEAISAGDYPEFRGYQVFYLNAADLLSDATWVPKTQSVLSFFSDAFGRYRNQIILVIDQIHLLGTSCDAGYIAEQLHAMLDHPEECFPYIIGMATESGLQQLQQVQPGFAGRFRCIPVEPTHEEETLHILRCMLQKRAPEIFVEDQTLRTLLMKMREVFGKDAVMPKFAVRILSQCIQRVADPQKIMGEKAVCFFERRRLLFEMKKNIYALALKISSGGSEREKKAFLILSRFIAPMLEKELEKEALLLKVHLAIDASLIDEVLREEKALQKKMRFQ